MANDRFKCHGYVAPPELHDLTSYSQTTFELIYRNRPNNFRYAIGSHYDVAARATEFVAWDLYEVRMLSGVPVVPEPMLRHSSLEALVFAVSLVGKR